MRFEVEDATPTAYGKAFRWLGQNMTAPTLMVSNTTEELRARYDYSSNPSAAYHVSVIYKDANEKRSFVDAQGMITDTTCEEHGCLDKVIRD